MRHRLGKDNISSLSVGNIFICDESSRKEMDNIAAHVARDTGTWVYLLNKSSEDFVTNIFMSEANISGDALKSGVLTSKQWENLRKVSSRLGESKLVLKDANNLSLTDICMDIKNTEDEIRYVFINCKDQLDSMEKSDKENCYKMFRSVSTDNNISLIIG